MTQFALARRLGVGDAVVIGLGSMIGAGVFAAFGPAARAAGTGLLIALGLAAIWSALRMGLPGVGRDYSGWRWAGLAALALPLTALVVGLGDTHAAMHGMDPHGGMRCTLDGLVAGLGVGAALFAWLKGGAPTSLERAGWVVGVAAGAAGAAVLALHCSSDNMVHIALWHGLVVILSAIAGRLILPPLLRW